jgi:hypothetical protein
MLQVLSLRIPSRRRRSGVRVVAAALVVWCTGLVASVAALWSPAQAQNPDSMMHAARVRYATVVRGRSRYSQVDCELDSLGFEHWRNGRGRLVAAFEGDTLRTLVATYGAHRDTVESYYFWRGAPVMIQVAFSGGAGRGTGANHGVAQQRFYFDHGYLIRWIDPAHTIRPATTGAVFARAMHLLADATRLVDAARRERDQLQLSPSPEQAAESMRVELKTLMTSERTYFAANNRYAGDLTAVNYQPHPAVAMKLLDASDETWAARATAAALPGKSCVAYLGHPHKEPRTAADRAHPTAEGDIVCDKP